MVTSNPAPSGFFYGCWQGRTPYDETTCLNALATRSPSAVLSSWMRDAMARGELRQSAPEVKAAQFLALLTAEVQVRLYQPASQPLEIEQVREWVNRAVEMFLVGAAAH